MDKRYYVIVTVVSKDIGLFCEFQVPGIHRLQWAEKLAEKYCQDGYRNREPDGWVYYPPHIIQTIAIKEKS